ncbi:MAG: hypothetical protein WBM90_07640, partial [Acidimicrobiia bacterium]
AATVDLDFFVCFFGSEATGDDNIVFSALGRGQDSDGAMVQVLVSETSAGVYFIGYRIDSEGTVSSWQRVGADAVGIAGDSVTAQGDFNKIIDGQPSDETDQGSFDGTCSPSSFGN